MVGEELRFFCEFICVNEVEIVVYDIVFVKGFGCYLG